jgi:hypothetical protein
MLLFQPNEWSFRASPEPQPLNCNVLAFAEGRKFAARFLPLDGEYLLTRFIFTMGLTQQDEMLRRLTIPPRHASMNPRGKRKMSWFKNLKESGPAQSYLNNVYDIQCQLLLDYLSLRPRIPSCFIEWCRL